MLDVGMYLSDRYEIVGKVGAGGMSDVYKAKDHILSRFVAVKVLKPEFSEDRNFVTKFRTEAQSAAGLEHPNIVNIYDVGSEDGLHYIVMEYVEGITLKTYVEKKGQLSFKESVSIAIQVARGIESAHNKHLIHRDIKPQNIIISTEGKVKVTDFGIARAASSNTISADVMGSVHYASPEQARNGFVDGRSDIYSLGIVMYEMVTGRIPFDGDTTVAVALQHLQEEMTPPSEYAPSLPISMEKIILKCTQKNPDRRYQNIEELLNDLRKALINPDEDFVVIAPLVDNGKTKIISDTELEQISKERRGIIPDAEETELLAEDEDDDADLDVEDIDEDEEDDGAILNPKMNKAFNIMLIVISVIIVIFAIYLVGSIFGLFKGSGSRSQGSEKVEESETGTEITVPMINVVGMTQEKAEAELRKIGLTLKVADTQETDEVEAGTILEQKTDEGVEVAAGTEIEVVVAGEVSASVTKVPDVVDKAESTATSELTEKNLIPKKNYEYNDTVAAGKVISQDPKGGTTVTEGTEVTLVISQGLQSVEVPGVTGYDKETASKTLTDAGLKVEVQEAYNDTVAEGKVIEQSPSAGKTVQKNATVTITVSKGAEVVYYSCKEEIECLEGTTAVDVTLKASDGTVLYSMNNYPFTKDKMTISKDNIVGYASGVIYVTFYGEEIIPGEDILDEEGNVIGKKDDTVKTIVLGQNTYPTTFTKQEQASTTAQE